jgi:4-amino-4-deoxy-L-arabinose transferase-like glycosyltransferase
MTSGRLWLAAVLALFCLPLFAHLGREDLENDEAIYSFGVDRILESGDWLAPKAIPYDDSPFLEKPPLKFWIVAAPIAAGLLPHDEFGLRFWDAAFGAAAFVYVYLIGARLLNPLGGAVAVLVLFTYPPLLFLHGLRTNNMEAALLLAYCGGVYHFLAWGGVPSAFSTGAMPGPSLPSRRASAAHACGVALYFVLGFMTKFVAALFLPLVLALAVALVPWYRARWSKGWGVWAAAGALAALLIAPWFVWAHAEYGARLWRSMIGDQVYTRFTASLDPNHLQPWHFYLSAIATWLRDAGVQLMAVGGTVGLVWLALRWSRPDGVVLGLWLVVPVVAISMGTSKLIHYVYPFLPPLALGTGYLAGLLAAVGPAPFDRVSTAVAVRGAARFPRTAAALSRPPVRAALLVLAAASLVVALVTVTFGQIRLEAGPIVLRSSGTFRPVLVAALCLIALGVEGRARRAVWLLIVAGLLPIAQYREMLVRLDDGPYPLQAAVSCIRGIEAGTAPRGIYVDAPDPAISHPMTYYLRRLRPWTRAGAAPPDALDRYISDPSQWRPIVASRPV